MLCNIHRYTYRQRENSKMDVSGYYIDYPSKQRHRDIDTGKVIYTSVIIRDFWTVTFKHTNVRFPA